MITTLAGNLNPSLENDGSPPCSFHWGLLSRKMVEYKSSPGFEEGSAPGGPWLPLLVAAAAAKCGLYGRVIRVERVVHLLARSP